MADTGKKNHPLPSSFYDKYIQDDENMQAKIKPILNEIQENRVSVKELHIQFGVRFFEIMNSYRNRLEELKYYYEKQISEFQLKQKRAVNKYNEVLEELKKKK